MKNKSNSKKLIISTIIILVVCLGLLTYSFRINMRRFVDFAIYSNQFHYLECDKMPSYEVSKVKFDQQKPKIAELIKKLETENRNSLPNGVDMPAIVISENQVIGGFITFKLDQICDDRAELNINFTSNKYLPEIKNFLDNNLSGIPYNLVND